MKELFKQLKYFIIISLILILLLSYFGIFNPFRKQLESSLNNNFEQLVSISEINLENNMKQFKEGAESLSSRTMIRNELADYKAGKISLDSLKEYTQDKYKDGADALNSYLAAYRISGDQIIAKSIKQEKFAIENYYDLDADTTQIDIFPELGIVVVSSPIIESGEKLGYDIVAFDLVSALKSISFTNVVYRIKRAEELEHSNENNSLIKDSRQILDTEYYLVASKNKSELYENLNQLSASIIAGIIIVSLLFAIIFKNIFSKTVQNVITKLEAKNKKLEKEIEYHQKYEMLFNNINSGVAVYEAVDNGENFIFKDLNKEGEKIDDIKRSEVIAKEVTEVFPGVKEFGLFEVLQKVYQTGEADKLAISKYQDERIVGYRSNYVYKLSTEEIVAVYDDVTEKKEQERNLKEVKNRLELAIEAANLGLWDWNNKTDQIVFNEKWANILGYQIEEIEQDIDFWKKRIHPDDKKRVLKEINLHLTGEKSHYQTEHRLRTKSGKWKWIRDIGKVVRRDKENNSVRIVGIKLDIDQQKRAKEKIKETNQKLEAQLEKGKRIHRNLLPENLLRFDNFEISNYYKSAEKIGADFHQIIDLKEKTILYISDTTGHSIDGAFLNIFLRETIKSFVARNNNSEENIPLDELIKHIRYEYQKEDFPDDYFISLIIFVIDKNKQIAKYVNAGIHIDPVLISKGEVCKLSVSGPPISNAIESELYNLKEQEFSLKEDSVLLATTDGLIEEEVDKEIYGRYRLEKIVKENYQLHPEILVDKIVNDLNDFAYKKNNFADDITLLTVSNRKLTDKLFFTIASDFNKIEVAKRRVDEFLKPYHSERIEILIALQELLMNAIEHGNKRINNAKVKIRVLVSDFAIDIEIEDEGEYFNWRDKINKEFDPLDFTERGRGLIIANKALDYLAYNQLANKAIMHIQRN